MAFSVKTVNTAQPLLYQPPAFNFLNRSLGEGCRLPAQLIHPDGRIAIATVPPALRSNDDFPEVPDQQRTEDGLGLESIVAFASLPAEGHRPMPGIRFNCILFASTMALQTFCVALIFSGGMFLPFTPNSAGYPIDKMARGLYSSILISHILCWLSIMHRIPLALDIYATLQPLFVCLICMLALNSVADLVIMFSTIVCWRLCKSVSRHVSDQVFILDRD